jgi:hypothetical protein
MGSSSTVTSIKNDIDEVDTPALTTSRPSGHHTASSPEQCHLSNEENMLLNERAMRSKRYNINGRLCWRKSRLRIFLGQRSRGGASSTM